MNPLLSIALAACPLTSPAPSGDPPPVPNFLILVVDDLGIDQLAIYDPENAYQFANPPNDYPYASTPRIDELAANGMRFTQARACPLCTPSRAALQSGDYGIRTGCGAIIRGTANSSTRFRELGTCPAPPITSLPQMLGLAAPAGVDYRSGFFGKAHLYLDCGDCGTGNDYVRDVLGYDDFAGIARNPDSDPMPEFPAVCDAVLPECSAPVQLGDVLCEDDPDLLRNQRQVVHSYYNWIESHAANPTDPTTVTNVSVEHGLCPGGCMSYSPTSFYFGEYLSTKERIAAGDWMAGTEEPFLAVVNFSSLHGPFQWPPDTSTSGDGHGFGPDQPRPCAYNTRIRAMLEHVDSAIGNLLDTIPPEVMENTYVFLIGDNGTDENVGETGGQPRYPTVYPGGGDPNPFVADPYPYFGWPESEGPRMKGTPYEAGVRVPLIVKGPGVDDGATSDALVDIVDFHETLRDLVLVAAGLTYTADLRRDSISFAPILRGIATPTSHKRQCSLAYRFNPNGYYQHDPSPPGSCPPPAGCMPDCTTGPHDVLKSEVFSYVRRDSCGNLWKLVRKREGTDPANYVHELYQLNQDPYELMGTALQPTHCMLPKLLQELDALLSGSEIAQMGGRAPLPVDCSTDCPL